jgi:hypothetical protein
VSVLSIYRRGAAADMGVPRSAGRGPTRRHAAAQRGGLRGRRRPRACPTKNSDLL